MRRFACYLDFPLLLCVALSVAGCAAVPSATSDAAGPDRTAVPLRVGISTNYPPLAFKEDGVIKGVEVDLSNRLSAQTDRRVILVERPFDQLIPGLLDGDVDVIMAGMTVTAEREALVSFTQSYLDVGQMPLIRAGDVGRMANPLAIYAEGLRVGFESGTTGERFVRENLTQATPVAFQGIEPALAALRGGEIDMYIHDAPTIWQVGNDPSEQDLMGLYRPLTSESLAWAVRKSDTALLQELDETLSALKASGELQAVINRWIPVSVKVQ